MRQVAYAPKRHQGGARPDSPGTSTCPAVDFLADLCTHIPDAGQQLIRYYGAWSHAAPSTRSGGYFSSLSGPTHAILLPARKSDFLLFLTNSNG
jgi:hypothetical protein